MKDIELKLICELMKNSRRSDRELAKRLNVSQPTVSRTIKRLENEGYIQEYTIIPNFRRLGFQIMAVVLTRMRKEVSPDIIEEFRSKVREDQKQNPTPSLMAMSGIGIDSDRVVIVLSEDYSAYTRIINMIRNYPLIEIQEVKSFLIDLSNEGNFRPTTMSWIAAYLEKKIERKK